MTEQEILDSFSRLLQNLLADDSIALQRETTRADIPEWDSFTYVNFIVAVEVELGIKFQVADIESFLNVGDIVDAAQALLD